MSGETQQLVRATLMLVMYLSLPALGVAALVGLLVGLFQAVTQIQDQSLPQTLKLVAVLLTVAVTAPLLGGALLHHTQDILDRFAVLAR